MGDSMTIREHFQFQAEACRRLGSPFTGKLCDLAAEHLSDDTRTGKRILSWGGDPSAEAVALRLAGALHALVLMNKDAGLASIYPPDGSVSSNGGDMWSIISAALYTHDEFICNWIDSPQQTNEVARAAMILPALTQLAEHYDLPLALFEIGASAGLTMQLIQFHYDYAGVRLGNAGSPVRLCPDVRTPPPETEKLPVVISRRGCDLNPLDPNSDGDAIRLRSYIWADQRARLDRMNGAMALYSASPPEIERSDAVAWIVRELDQRPRNAISVFYHTIFWQYLSQAAKYAIEQSLVTAGSMATPDNPLAFLGMEGYGNPDYARLDLTTWSGNAEMDGQMIELAHVDYHGRWIDWKHREEN